VVDAPDCELIFVVGAASVGSVALAVFDGETVLDEMLLRTVEADTEDACIDDLVYAFVELEEDGIEVERCCDFFADVTEELDAFFLSCNLGGLGANLLSAFVDGCFQGLGLSLKSFLVATGLFAFMSADE